MKTVTAIMPTRGRVEWARQSLDCFLAQTYPSKSMVIIDDADEPSFPDGFSGPEHRAIYYSRMNIRYAIPQKLNMACEIARVAHYIVKWDSDDWYSPTRIEEQVKRLEESAKAVTGYNSFFFYDVTTGKQLEFVRKKAFACGSSLTFLRSFWEKNRFKENHFTGSDNHFVYAAISQDQLDYCHGGHSLVARIHSGNTSPKEGYRRGPEYVEVFGKLPAAFLELEQVPA